MEDVFAKIFVQWGFPGLIIASLGGIIAYLIWDRLKDAKREKEIEEKKRNGTYKSWESMDERIMRIEKQIEESVVKKAVQDEKNAHFTETLVRLEKGQDNIYTMISEIKSYLIKQ